KRPSAITSTPTSPRTHRPSMTSRSSHTPRGLRAARRARRRPTPTSRAIHGTACNSELGRGDGYVSLAPRLHITGVTCQFLAAVAGGARLILNYRFQPGSLIALCDEQKPAYMAGPATVYTAMMAHPDFDAEKFASFKSLMSGGAPLPEGLVRKFEQRAGIY